MNNDPEKAANQNGEEIKEGKEPGERKLLTQRATGRGGETDNERYQEAGRPDSQERQQESVDVSALKNLRSGNGQMLVAHRSYRVCVVSVFAGCPGAVCGGAFCGFPSFSSAAL